MTVPSPPVPPRQVSVNWTSAFAAAQKLFKGPAPHGARLAAETLARGGPGGALAPSAAAPPSADSEEGRARRGGCISDKRHGGGEEATQSQTESQTGCLGVLPQPRRGSPTGSPVKWACTLRGGDAN